MFEFLRPKKQKTTVPPAESATFTVKSIPVSAEEVPDSVTVTATTEPETDEAAVIPAESADVRTFTSEMFGELRTVMQDGEPWFVAADVCRALEISNNRDALSRLDADEKGVASTDTPGGRQEMAIVSEAGLYSLVLGSRKPEAKQFKRWITHEVIPSIRQHGVYATPQTAERLLNDPDFAIKLFQQIKDERDKSARLESENHELVVENGQLVWKNKELTTRAEQAEELARKNEAKAVFADSFIANAENVNFQDMARLIQNRGGNVTQTQLIAYLKSRGMITKDRLPTEQEMRCERRKFVIEEGVGKNGYHYRQTKITPYGQAWLYRIFCGETYRAETAPKKKAPTEDKRPDLMRNAREQRVRECTADVKTILESAEAGEKKKMTSAEIRDEWIGTLGKYVPGIIAQGLRLNNVRFSNVVKDGKKERKYHFPVRKAETAETPAEEKTVEITASHTDAERKEICYNVVKMLLRENADSEPYWQYITLEAFKDNHPRLSPFTETEIYMALLKMDQRSRNIMGTLTFRLPV